MRDVGAEYSIISRKGYLRVNNTILSEGEEYRNPYTFQVPAQAQQTRRGRGRPKEGA